MMVMGRHEGRTMTAKRRGTGEHVSGDSSSWDASAGGLCLASGVVALSASCAGAAINTR